jgi:signal transduction histidine kinase
VRLASRIFLACSLVILVLGAVGGAGLHSVRRLVSVNREMTIEALPALRLAGSVRDTMLALARLEARHAILPDPRYAELWRERAGRARVDLERLGQLVRTQREAEHLRAARVTFEQYVAAVTAEHARPPAARAPDREPVGRELGERVEADLEMLIETTHARMLQVQAEAAELEARTWATVVLSLVSAVVLAVVGTGIIALRMTRSLRRLSAATTAVAAGDFREPLPAGRRDEIGELARAFNAMAARLRQVDDMKEEFFATISHELRSPLTSVREAAHLLGDGVAGPLTPKQARLTEIIARSSDRLLRLVNQLLEVGRLRAGVMPLERVPLDLDRVVTRALDELRPQAEEAGVTLTRDRVGEPCVVSGDEERLLQLAVNLVGNAIRFTPRGGRVTVRVVGSAPEAELQVEDTGIGIPADALPHVFESYRQAHQGRGGTGLGLSIVRGIALAHGGRVTAESQEGKGSRFTVLLPRPRGEAA